MNIETLHHVASTMVAPKKGILAIDESTATCTKRFESVGVKSNEENRRQYRQMIITAPQIENYLSGMIMYDETIRQKTDEGIAFPKVLADKGILTGIKVDTGAKDLAGFAGEKVTEGLDGLRDRLSEYKALGASFAKWRAVITIGEDMPSDTCLKANTHGLARYASLCQEQDIVPMVEPEIIFDGDHSIEDCYEVSSYAWRQLFNDLYDFGVVFEGLILKTSMVMAGKDAQKSSSVQEVADATVQCFLESVPASLAGIVFLSGGQSNQKATAHLNEINKKYRSGLPWPVSFSYGRGIQSEALKIWAKDPQNNVQEAQKEILDRSQDNSLASQGMFMAE